MFYVVFVYTCIYASDFLIKNTCLLEQKTKILAYFIDERISDYEGM
jgi:hypothetical protein